MTLKIVEKGVLSVNVHLPGISGLELSTLKNLTFDAKVRQSYLALLHGRYWIACDCNTKDTPYLTIRKSNNTYHLVNLNAHGQHIKTCSLSTKNIKRHDVAIEHEMTDNYIFEKHVLSKKTKPQLPESSPLYPLIKKILSKAGFESITSSNTYQTNELSLLDMGVEGVSFNSQPLSEIFNIGYANFKKHKQSILDGKYSELLIIDVMDEYIDDGKSLTFKKHYSKTFYDSFKFFKSLTQVELLSDSISEMCKGPYLVLSNLKNISTNPDKKFIVPSFVTVIPVASKSQWCLVSNDYERQVITQLLKSLKWYNEKKYGCSIKKPFDSVSTPIGHCHPDFIIGDLPKQQIIEVMASNERSYATLKLASHIVMSSIGKVSVFNPFEKSAKELNAHCFEISNSTIMHGKVKTLLSYDVFSIQDSKHRKIDN
jgi:hypothetical protein